MRAQGMGIDRDLAVQVLEDVESVLATLGSAGYTLRDLSIRHIMLQVCVSSVSASSVPLYWLRVRVGWLYVCRSAHSTPSIVLHRNLFLVNP